MENKTINALFGKRASDRRVVKRKRDGCSAVQLSQLLPPACSTLLSFCPRLLICLLPPVTTWFSFARDSFSPGKIRKAIKKNKLFLGQHQFQSLGGSLNNFSLASARGETWSPKVTPSITPKPSSGQQPRPRRALEAASKWPPRWQVSVGLMYLSKKR